jgi:hypothetical protein
VTRSKPFGIAARRAILMLAVAVLLVPFGVPRWFAGDEHPDGSDTGAAFARLCRQHGGTPVTTPASGTTSPARRECTIRYGDRVYVMDAITPAGFDEDTARYQRRGCAEARRQQSASAAAGDRPQSFIYHPSTGVCERRD